MPHVKKAAKRKRKPVDYSNAVLALPAFPLPPKKKVAGAAGKKRAATSKNTTGGGQSSKYPFHNNHSQKIRNNGVQNASMWDFIPRVWMKKWKLKIFIHTFFSKKNLVHTEVVIYCFHLLQKRRIQKLHVHPRKHQRKWWQVLQERKGQQPTKTLQVVDHQVSIVQQFFLKKCIVQQCFYVGLYSSSMDEKMEVKKFYSYSFLK